MIAFANGFSHPGKFARVALTGWGSTPHTSKLAKVCASVKNSRAGCCASANALFRERRGFEINSRPGRARTHASPGQGNEFGRTIECIAHSIAGRFGRRVRQRAKHPGKAVPWVLRLSRSWLLHGGKKYNLEGLLSGAVPPHRLCSRRCKQYTPARRPLPPCDARYLLPRGYSRGQIVPSHGGNNRKSTRLNSS